MPQAIPSHPSSAILPPSGSSPGVAALAAQTHGEVSAAYRRYVIGVIWLVLLFRFVDLQIIAVLLESIRREFQITDTQLGLLSGTAFAIFYGSLGIPIAWLADRYRRRDIIAACLALWSGMTALCGTASGFGSLFLMRMGVGVGEAGGAPPGYSLISDYVPPARRSTAFAILNSAIPMGVFVGFIVGAFINARYGWRVTLGVVGLAGLIVAIIIRLTVREPPRGRYDAANESREPESTLVTIRELWRLRAYRHFVAASSLFTLGATGSGIWIASFFVREHHMDPLQVATWLAFIYGGGGLLGATMGGVVADRIAARTGDARWQARLPAITTAAILPFSLFVYLWPDPIVALIVHLGTTFLMHSWMGPAYGTVQNLAGPRRRAMAAAINLLAVNLIALGLGPLLVGALSDYIHTWFATSSLRYSILSVVAVTYTWASVHFWLASRTLHLDLRAASGASAQLPAGKAAPA
ncbi:MAG: MFS transporter [Gammaproteobacteria bacterium]